MTPAVTPPPMPARVRVPSGPPRDLKWTVEMFHFLGDLGMFEGRRAWLVDGVIVEEGPMNPPHAIAATKTEDAIRDAVGKAFHVRVAKPLVLGLSTDPEPDVAVVSGKAGDYTAHPTTAALVVEVSDSSLKYDTTTKLGVYAAGGIGEYWVLDVTGRQLLVFRDPQPDAAHPHGHSYATRLTFGATDCVSPLAAPTASVRVADLLP
jgi:Uma2 family endonuclease